jgi:gas vesicle protein
MGDGYDRFENEGGGGGSFVIGLLTGTVLGAGLGMLFAPKSGSELRGKISEQAGNLANTAQEGYRRASETAGEWADRGRELYDKARDAISRGADEAERYAREAGAAASPSSGTGPGSYSSGSTGSSYGTGSSGSSFGSSGGSGSTGGTRRS